MAAHFLKRHVNKSIHTNAYGSAIIFWHEAQGCPPTCAALPLSDIEALEPGARVSEKTLCNARYRGRMYRCVVLWIEEDKTPDELIVARLLPSSNKKIFEEKGYRWARELQHNERSHLIDLKSGSEDGVPLLVDQKLSHQDRLKPEDAAGDSDLTLNDQKHYGNASDETDRMEYHEEHQDRNNAASPAYDSSAASASSGTYGSHTLRPHTNDISSDKPFNNHKQGRKQKLPTKACSMIQIVTPAQRMVRESSIRSTSPLMNDLDEDEDDLEHFPMNSSTSVADTTSLGISTDSLVQRMILESTWTKALRCAMRELFTGDELATSLPHQSKSGMNVLDPHRLAVAKDLLVKYCASKDIPQPSRRHVSQALHNCLISSRTSKFRMKKFSNLSRNPKFNFGNGDMSGKATKFREIIPRRMD